MKILSLVLLMFSLSSFVLAEDAKKSGQVESVNCDKISEKDRAFIAKVNECGDDVDCIKKAKAKFGYGK